jgi:hypothetical protein
MNELDIIPQGANHAVDKICNEVPALERTLPLWELLLLTHKMQHFHNLKTEEFTDPEK